MPSFLSFNAALFVSWPEHTIYISLSVEHLSAAVEAGLSHGEKEPHGVCLWHMPDKKTINPYACAAYYSKLY